MEKQRTPGGTAGIQLGHTPGPASCRLNAYTFLILSTALVISPQELFH